MCDAAGEQEVADPTKRRGNKGGGGSPADGLANGLVAVRIVVRDKIFATSLQRLKAAAAKVEGENAVIKDLAREAEANPGETITLNRSPTAYPFVMQWLNRGSITGVTCVKELTREARYLGLAELERMVAKGHFVVNWRSSPDMDALSNHIANQRATQHPQRPTPGNSSCPSSTAPHQSQALARRLSPEADRRPSDASYGRRPSDDMRRRPSADSGPSPPHEAANPLDRRPSDASFGRRPS
eukprot:CAMPEP_0174931514 /NCGR_PEP_ID=MMETSP1355-20121228/33921_1 /TAXON_ID=464990 /ORGANISM="Hemiselmis tepida, Strain CCMP443" /LENGTH=240 /DNA_ID=CAMNT_0016177875 /DNA_START=84 /DNA_END=802 /DNA_ORIENTATION=+